MSKQAGAVLGQAQLKLGLEFTLLLFYCIELINKQDQQIIIASHGISGRLAGG